MSRIFGIETNLLVTETNLPVTETNLPVTETNFPVTENRLPVTAAFAEKQLTGHTQGALPVTETNFSVTKIGCPNPRLERYVASSALRFACSQLDPIWVLQIWRGFPCCSRVRASPAPSAILR